MENADEVKALADAEIARGREIACGPRGQADPAAFVSPCGSCGATDSCDHLDRSDIAKCQEMGPAELPPRAGDKRLRERKHFSSRGQ